MACFRINEDKILKNVLNMKVNIQEHHKRLIWEKQDMKNVTKKEGQI
jgi:hypothetical protein